jgi:hypothetical protein
MKRHPTLQQLSRDHQLALAVALELTRAVEATAPAARARFLNFWRAEGRQHFRQEEEILLPAFARRGDPRHPIVARVLTDHVELRGDAAGSRRMRIHHPQYFAGSATSEGRLNRYEKQP